MAALARAIGIDFGTTNTVISAIGADGEAHLVSFPAEGGEIVAFRSALSFHAPPEDPAGRVVEAGPWAIEAYVEEPLETRFIQSFKSYAASPLFRETRILGRRYPLRGPALHLPAASARPRRRRRWPNCRPRPSSAGR